jgi:Arc/MetJ-type ribon-helix-helix transcriptional regulator
MMRNQKKVTRGLRYDAELNNRIEAATKQGGFSCSSAFIRAAIERELAGRESGVDAAEQRIAASLDRMA